MRRLVLTTAAIVATLGVISPFSPAHAQATRTWVSGVGDDVNPCSRTAPCKTFAGAISKTAAGGEINCLDPAGYGAVTITKSITIACHYTYGSILASGVNGVVVNAGANDIITLRGLSINGAGTTLGVNGIRFLAGKALIVDGCNIFGFSNSGIDIALAATASVDVRNSVFSNIAVGGTTTASIQATSSAGVAVVRISNSSFFGGPKGIRARAGSFISAREVTIGGATVVGAQAESSGTVNLDSSFLANNNTGISAEAGGTVIISNNSFYGNSAAFFIGGVMRSAGNNKVDGTAGGSPNANVPGNL
jgi:hypothetical protein